MRRAFGALGAVTALLLVGCGSGGSERPSAAAAEPGASTTVASIAAPETATLAAPAPMETASTILGYRVVVTAYAADATAAVQGGDDRNRPPEQGRYSIVTMSVVNEGVDPAVPSRDLAVLVVGGDGTTTRHWDCGAHLGGRALFDGARVYPGGRVSGDVCFDLAPASSDGATIVVTSAEDPLSEADTWFWGP